MIFPPLSLSLLFNLLLSFSSLSIFHTYTFSYLLPLIDSLDPSRFSLSSSFISSPSLFPMNGLLALHTPPFFVVHLPSITSRLLGSSFVRLPTGIVSTCLSVFICQTLRPYSLACLCVFCLYVCLFFLFFFCVSVYSAGRFVSRGLDARRTHPVMAHESVL